MKLTGKKAAAIVMLSMPVIVIGIMCLANGMAKEFLEFVAVSSAVIAVGFAWIFAVVNLWEDN